MTPETTQRSLGLLNFLENGLGGLDRSLPDAQRLSFIDQMQGAVRELRPVGSSLGSAGAEQATRHLDAVQAGLERLRAAQPDGERFTLVAQLQGAVQQLRGLFDLPSFGRLDATIDAMFDHIAGAETSPERRALLEQARAGMKKGRPS